MRKERPVCEFCRNRGIKRYSCDSVNIDGIDWWLCWDCKLDNLERIDKENYEKRAKRSVDQGV
jgi:hypothetical protein